MAIPDLEEVEPLDEVPVEDVPVEQEEFTPPEYEAPPAYEPTEEALVANQLTGILAKDSPYLQAARTRGKEYANNRGLLNSSIGAGATERSAIESALPIAQQDAGVYSQAGLLAQEASQQAALTNLQAAASSQLSEQESRQSLSLENLQQEGANYRQETELAYNEKIALLNIAADEKSMLSSHMTTLGDNFQAKLAGIQVDPGMTAEAKSAAIKSLQNAYEANLQSLSAIFNIEIDWELPNAFVTPEPTPVPYVPPAPPAPPEPQPQP